MNEVRLIDANALKEKINAFYDKLFVGVVSSDLITYASGVDGIIDNAPTYEQKDFEQVLQPITVDVSKVDIEKIKEELNNSFNTVTTEQLFSDCERLHVEPEPVSERQKRALAIVDALTEKHLINVMERGCLRRSILLEPERPQVESIPIEDGLKKARRGNYVIYDVDFLLDNLAREVNIMESARQWKAGKGNDND